MSSKLGVQNIAHTNGTNAMTVNSDAVVSLPNIPYLTARVDNNKNVSPSGTTGIVIWDTVLASRGILLNTTTGVFTVPINGLYNFNAAVRLNADYNFIYWQVRNQDDSAALQGQKLVMAHGKTGATFSTAVGSVLLPLTTSTNYAITVATNTATSVAISSSQTWLDINFVG